MGAVGAVPRTIAQRSAANVRRLVDEVFHQGALDVLDEVFAATAGA
jgi:hypothetical protein